MKKVKLTKEERLEATKDLKIVFGEMRGWAGKVYKNIQKNNRRKQK